MAALVEQVWRIPRIAAQSVSNDFEENCISCSMNKDSCTLQAVPHARAYVGAMNAGIAYKHVFF